MRGSPIPYCGTPPSPGELWARWNLDPTLIVVLLLILAFYAVARARSRTLPSWRTGAFFAGWMVLTAALISPICPLSVSLFSARVGQHMVLTLIAAPLLMFGRPFATAAVAWPALSGRVRRPTASSWAKAAAATATFTLAIWFWHAPGPYAATFASDLIYWAMHITVIGAALLLWAVLLDGRTANALPALAAGAVSTLQMTLLGALITLTPHALYAPHALTAYAWGLSPLDDQQLGGLIMWVPGCTVFLAATLATLGRLMAERPAAALA